MINRFKRIYSVCHIPSRLGHCEALLQAASCAGDGQQLFRDALSQAPSAERFPTLVPRHDIDPRPVSRQTANAFSCARACTGWQARPAEPSGAIGNQLVRKHRGKARRLVPDLDWESDL